jgi:hypothetical protein
MRLSDLRAGRALPLTKTFLVIIYVRGGVTVTSVVLLEGSGKLGKFNDLFGIQILDQLRNPIPPKFLIIYL